MSIERIEPCLQGDMVSVGIVVSRFNEYAGKEELEACLEELKALGVQDENITVVSVPGALEIPFAMNYMADDDRYDALIALGAVIRGETYHFDVVSDVSARALAKLSAETGMPIANGILTVENDEQCKARTAMKGRDCARVAVEMAQLRDVLYLRAVEDEIDDDDDDDDDDEVINVQ